MHYYTDVLKKYVEFSGRATRREFWMFAMWNAIVVIVLWIIESILIQATGSDAFMALIWLYAIAVFLPSLAVTLRRLHDAGLSGWWVLIDLVPFVGGIVLIILLVQPTKNGGSAVMSSSSAS